MISFYSNCGIRGIFPNGKCAFFFVPQHWLLPFLVPFLLFDACSLWNREHKSASWNSVIWCVLFFCAIFLLVSTCFGWFLHISLSLWTRMLSRWQIENPLCAYLPVLLLYGFTLRAGQKCWIIYFNWCYRCRWMPSCVDKLHARTIEYATERNNFWVRWCFLCALSFSVSLNKNGSKRLKQNMRKCRWNTQEKKRGGKRHRATQFTMQKC